MTIAVSLLLLNNTKAAIKSAIEAKGVTVGSVPFASYPAKIAAIGGYQRPYDWLAMPVLTTADNKFVGLHAVFPDANYVALSAAGAYTVDWGDGTVENIATGVTAQHEYNYATYDASNTTLCTRGYKQAIVTVTPQAGQSFTSLNLQFRNSAMTATYSTGWLDLAISGAALTTLVIGALSSVVTHSLLEVAHIVKNSCADLSYLFSTAYSLQSVQVDSSSATTLASMFSACGSLRKAPVLDTSKCLTFTSLFSACTALINIPTYSTALGTNFSGMFQNARVIALLPALDLTSATNLTNSVASAYNISDINFVNIGVSLNVAGLKLTAARLNEIFGNLKTTTGQTVTITNNPGATTCDRTIATAKGWTVTG
jgi:hypothetical protein